LTHRTRPIKFDPYLMQMTLKTYEKLFKDTSFGMAIFDASNLKLEMANGSMLQLWGRDKSVLHTGLLDFMPELSDQEYPDLLRNVANTGNAYSDHGAEVLINKFGVIESIFMDYSYLPVTAITNKPTSILVVAKGLCYKQLNKLITEETDKNLTAMVNNSPIAMCVFKGPDLKVKIVNSQMRELWNGNEGIGMHELLHVFHNAVPYTRTLGNITYTFTPLVDYFGKVNGISVMGKTK
jgi:hypothetical protein